MNSHYTIIIQWSDEDECFVVSLPEWGEFCHTHGETYEEAFKNAQEVLEVLIESSLADGEPLPEPKTLGKSLLVLPKSRN
jgi:antitoxin HicB